MDSSHPKTCFVRLLLLFVAVFPVQGIFSQTVISDNIKNAQASFAQLDAQNSYKDDLNHVDMNRLPSGFKQTINNMEVTVAVSGAEFYAEYTSLSTFLRIKIPGENSKMLFFGAENIKLSHDGGIIGDARLVLLSDIEIPISDGNILLRLKGDFNKKTGQSKDLSYVTIDCKGFKQLGVSAEVELSPQLCYPVDVKGDSILSGKVIGKFQTEIEDWNDIVASVSFPSFALKGLDGFIWNVEDAVFDFSDQRNGRGFSFPEAYRPYFISGNEMLWRGVYVRNLSVTLPPQFSQNEGKRVSFLAQDMLIDDNGITGKFGASNVLAFDQGNAGGWSFSVDYFGLELLANRLEGARFTGELGLPISEKSKLGYEGVITADDKYVLKVSSVDTLSFDLLQAKAQLYDNSYVEFKVDKGKFKPEAMLHGRMGIMAKLPSSGKDGTGGEGKEIARFEGIEFRSLHLKTESPYLSVEYFGYKGETRLLNFPVSVKDMALTTRGNEAILGMDIDVTLMDGAFAGNTRLLITGKMEEGQLHKWRHTSIEVEKINIEATVGGTFALKGGLTILHDDPLYGDGFGGDLSASFTDRSPLKGLTVKVRGMFGCTDFRYWFVDGIVKGLPGGGIPIGPGIRLNGFGGGISYRMKPNGIQASGGGNVLSATSMTYVPNEKSSLGIKASVALVIPKKETIQGEACFELSFNTNGGLSYAGFYGYVQVLGSIPGVEDFEKQVSGKYKKIIDKEQAYLKNNETLAETLKKYKQYDPNEASKILMSDQTDQVGKNGLTAAVGIQFNFAESSFHATFDLYVNLLGGLFRGTASGNRAGYAVLHIDPQDWYVHMGTPTDRIGLKMGIGKILSIETGSYLMLGTKIPASPGVPSQVSSILGYSPDDLDYMKDLNLLGEGSGFAFGSSLNISTGDLTFLILYANYSTGLGFDLMLKDYGDAQCKGHNGAIGLDGWYANGQAYAYMHGELGAKINLWFMKKKVPIFRADVATLMQAKLPNPSSFKAYLAVKVKVLGIVNVNCRFKILIGEDCELIAPGSSPLDMQMISDFSPTDMSDDISVFTAPQATFNMAIGKAFDVQDDDGKQTYRIQLKDFVLNDGQNVTGKLKWNEDKDAVSFYSRDILSPEKDVTATVRVVFEQLKSGKWVSVYTSGKEAVESKTVTFHTGDAPKDIPLWNIVYAYPVIDQKYYLKDESEKGYIQLERGQSYLFPAGLKNQVVFEDNTGNRKYTDFKYDESQKRIDYTVPSIDNSASYSMSLVSLNQGSEGSAPAGKTFQTVVSDDENGNISVENRLASAETRTDGVVLLNYGFASSRYGTLHQKILNLEKARAIAVVISFEVLMFGYEMQDMEPFDPADLTGTEWTGGKSLIDVTATLEDTYYQQHIYPLIYQDYPVAGNIRVKREDAGVIGVPPVRALPLRTDYLNRIEQGEYDGIATKRFPYYYNLPAVYKEDFVDLQRQVINSMMGKGGAAYNRFLRGSFPFILPGYYKIKMQYVLPGNGNMTGSSVSFDYKNFIE
jgi:hypothetical protein